MTDTRPLKIQTVNFQLNYGAKAQFVVPIMNPDGTLITGTTGWTLGDNKIMPLVNPSPLFQYSWGMGLSYADFSTDSYLRLTWYAPDIHDLFHNTPTLLNQCCLSVIETGATVGSLLIQGTQQHILNALQNV